MQINPKLYTFILFPYSLNVNIEPASSVEMGGRVHSFPLCEEVTVPEFNAKSEWFGFGPFALGIGVDVGGRGDIG